MSRISNLRPLRLLAVASAAVAVMGVGLLGPAGSAKADSTYTLNFTVHYYRADGNYSNPWGAGAANLWTWDAAGSCTLMNGEPGTSSNPPVDFTGTDGFGILGTISYSCDTANPGTDLGYIIRDNSWNKDTSNDRHQTISYGTAPNPGDTVTTAVWVLSGDATNYESLADANFAKFTQVKSAVIKGKHQVLVTLSKAFKLTNLMLKGQGWTLKPQGKLAKGVKKSYSATAQADGESYPNLDAVVVGDLQSAAGDPGGNWNPGSTYTKMKQVGGDLYEYTATLPPDLDGNGNYQAYSYKVNIGGAWSCNGCYAVPGGLTNLSLELDGTEAVTFYFQPYGGGSVWDSVNNPTTSLPGQPGSTTDKVLLTFPKSYNLNSKTTYKITGPGVPTASFK